VKALHWISRTTRLLILVALGVESGLILGIFIAARFWDLLFGWWLFGIAAQVLAIPLFLLVAFSLTIDAFVWLRSRP